MKQALEEIIATLKLPLSDDERQAGWRKSVKDSYVPVFAKLLAQLERGEDRAYFGIARSLDAYGINTGDLYERMLSIANESNAQLGRS